MQTPEAHAAQAIRLVPRLRLAAGAAAAAHGPRGAFRLRLPDPAHRRHEIARRPVGPGEGFHRPARLVRGLSTGRRLDRPRSHLGPARRRRPHSARLHAGARRRGAGHRRGRRGRGRVRAPHERGARLGSAARHQALHRRAVDRDREAGPRRSTRSCSRATCASPWAASPRSCRWTIRTARSGTPRRWGPTSAGSPSSSTTGSRRNTRRRACRISARASGIPASSCRAGRSTASGAATASRSGTNPALLADEKHDRGVTAGRRAASSSPASPSDSGLSPEYVFAAYEDAFYYLWRERRLPANVDPFKSRLDDALERARLARVFEQGLDAVVGHVLPVARDVDGHALADRALVPAPRALLPDSGRLAARVTGCRSIRMPWVTQEDYPYISAPDPMAPPAPLPRHADIRRQLARDRVEDRDAASRQTPRAAAKRRAQAATSRPTAWSRRSRAGFLAVRDRDHAHRDVRRAAQRRALHLHAARRHARGLPRARRRGRSHRGRR